MNQLKFHDQSLEIDTPDQYSLYLFFGFNQANQRKMLFFPIELLIPLIDHNLNLDMHMQPIAHVRSIKILT